ncbi:outer membrane protein [Mesorhizobium sp. RIZ17]|uniref:outer membrane protein n=1 Tax=Mesorhizobium sp. RIZ17 TaxID=3132743 RepID=UPI003DA82810
MAALQPAWPRSRWWQRRYLRLGSQRIGGDLETAVSNNMTVGLEYRYSQYEKVYFASGGLFEDTPRIQTVRIDAKYKFN